MSDNRDIYGDVKTDFTPYSHNDGMKFNSDWGRTYLTSVSFREILDVVNSLEEERDTLRESLRMERERIDESGFCARLFYLVTGKLERESLCIAKIADLIARRLRRQKGPR